MVGDDKLNVPSTSPSVSPSRKRSADLAELRKQRGNLRGRLTQYQNYLDKFIDCTPSPTEIKQIRFRMKAAIDLFKIFNEVESTIELISSDSDIASNSEYVESFESLYFNVLAIAETLVENGEAGDSSSNSKSNSHISRANVKLPDIKLPSFDGSFDRWLEYKNSYLTMIHKRTDLDEIQKFHYLRSSLSGSALQVISALEFTQSNYIHAWNLLENRFHNTRLLTHNHLKSLFSIPSLKQESHTQIRRLIDTVLRNLRALKSLDEPTDSWDTIIIYLISTKLDSSTEREWENHKGSILLDSNRKLKLDDLLNFLKNKADMLDMLNANQNKIYTKSTLNDTKISQQNQKSTHSYVSTQNTLINKSKSINNKRIINCPSCNANHALYTCYKFLNLPVESRLKFIKDKQLCLNCLRPGHTATDCLFGPCKQCESKHNTLLHQDSVASYSCVGSEHTADYRSEPQASTSTALHSLSLHAYNNFKNSNENISQQVLLCTALVDIVDNKRVHTVRALLDSGSQHSFISNNLRKRLNAPLIQSTIRISGVAQTVTQSNESCEIIIRSKLNDYSAKVQCLVLQRITSSLPTTNIDTTDIRIPNHIQLADPTFNISSEVDLLIGADLFWDILNEKKIRLINGPHLQDSKLGWLLCGPINTKGLNNNNLILCNFNQTINEQFKRSCEKENLSPSREFFTQDDNFCEKLFNKSIKRKIYGRFSVRAPFKESRDKLGNSYNIAKRRFFSL